MTELDLPFFPLVNWVIQQLLQHLIEKFHFASQLQEVPLSMQSPMWCKTNVRELRILTISHKIYLLRFSEVELQGSNARNQEIEAG